MYWIAVLLMLSGMANAQSGSEADLRELIRARINPSLRLIEGAHQSGANFYRGNWQSPSAELLVRATRLTDLSVAGNKVSQIESLNIQNLYRQRRNPYEGQVTETVLCDPKLGPLVSEINVNGHPTTLTCGGVNARNGFGACSKEKMVRWGCHFSVEISGVVLDMRLFSKTANGDALANLRADARKLLAR